MAKYKQCPYLFRFLDKDGNELCEARAIICFSKKESMRYARFLIANSQDKYLQKIKTRKIYE